MNQPGLGLEISELGQQKGMTQEQLSECCQVSSRTIQRIENGEVDPRTHTTQCLIGIFCTYQAEVNVMQAMTDKPRTCYAYL